MHELDIKWMAYIDREVRAACDERGWGYQVRRKWTARDKPVPQSPADDYEWKLVPGANHKLPDQPSCDIDEGTYYVLAFDPEGGRFVLQHDTVHCGIDGPHWHQRSYTEIYFVGNIEAYDFAEVVRQAQEPEHARHVNSPPGEGWLRKHLIDLTARFKPNHFSIT